MEDNLLPGPELVPVLELELELELGRNSQSAVPVLP